MILGCFGWWARREERLCPPYVAHSNIPELRAFALGELWNRLPDDDLLEMPGLLVVGEGGFAGEHLVEEELLRLRRVLVDLEFPHAGFLLRLRKKILQQSRDAAFLAGLDFPERRHDQILIGAVLFHRVLSFANEPTRYGSAMDATMPASVSSMLRWMSNCEGE